MAARTGAGSRTNITEDQRANMHSSGYDRGVPEGVANGRRAMHDCVSAATNRGPGSAERAVADCRKQAAL